MPNRSFFSTLARSIQAGEATLPEIIERLRETLGRPWRWIQPLAQRYLEAFSDGTRPRRRDVIRFLREDRGFRRARAKYWSELSATPLLSAQARMQPVPAAAGWDIPVIETVGALADWFAISVDELDWFADLKGLCYKNRSPKLRHYHYRVLVKDSGSIRLIEAPKSRLKILQRQILTQILDRIPSHGAVHGLVRGRSIKTFAAPHTTRRVVLRMDLQDFFPSFIGARIQTFFRTLGYPEPVADLLGGLCTNATPRNVWMGCAANWDVRALYASPHLPQGAPTSPALANLCAYRIDCRLLGLAKSAGAEYTRYADDLAFSGDADFEKRVERFSVHAAAILLEDGFSVNHRKTRIMRQGVRQHVAGIVVNRHINVQRDDFDRLKAILTNCIRHGAASQNRDAHSDFRAHIEGRIAFVQMVNPVRGSKLRKLFEQIHW